MNGLKTFTLAAAMAAPGCVTVEAPGPCLPCPRPIDPCHNAELAPPPAVRLQEPASVPPPPVTPGPFTPPVPSPVPVPLVGPAVKTTGWHVAPRAMPWLDGPGW